jgi:mono/diheme cytochrome c family protein
MKKIIAVAGMVFAAGLLSAPGAYAQGSGAGGRFRGFTEQGGEALYKNICQGCHMPNGQGAVGAGAYPALAKNTKLEVAGYPIAVVVNGQKAMPAFGPMLSDQQIADVINYVRSHFGNNYKDKVTPADVKQARS